MKYIFITGGVVSSVGKGLAAAALGTLLEHRGLKVVLQKFDPYLNVDPGTMNPFQHGEVYVLNDGAETDLDFGHYERFTNSVLTRHNSLTSGQVYETVIGKERRGDYLGKTVQVIPHVTDEIKARIRLVEKEQPADVLITEIGGTTGDIEGLPFLEAIRQFTLEVGPRNAIVIHVTLVPYIKAAGELKTKPSQQSVARLREIGLQAQVLICRTEQPLEADVRAKLSMYCNIPASAVVEMRDVAHTIYEAPLMLQAERVDETVCELLDLKAPPADMTDWKRFVSRVVHPKKSVKIALVGKYIDLQDAYKSIYESLTHAAASHDSAINLLRIDAETLEEGGEALARALEGVTGIVVPGGFRRARHRGEDPGRRLRPAAQGAVSGVVSGHAGGDHRVRPQRLRVWRTPTAPSSTSRRRIPSSACSKNSARCARRARRCASGSGRQRLPAGPSPRRFTAGPKSRSATVTATNSTTNTGS